MCTTRMVLAVYTTRMVLAVCTTRMVLALARTRILEPRGHASGASRVEAKGKHQDKSEHDGQGKAIPAMQSGDTTSAAEASITNTCPCKQLSPHSLHCPLCAHRLSVSRGRAGGVEASHSWRSGGKSQVLKVLCRVVSQVLKVLCRVVACAVRCTCPVLCRSSRRMQKTWVTPMTCLTRISRERGSQPYLAFSPKPSSLTEAHSLIKRV